MPERLLFMEKNKHTGVQEKVDYIVDFYFHGQSEPSLDRKIREWLADGQDGQEKDEALKRQWDRQVGETRPDKETYAALAEIRSRLGFDESPLRVRRVSFTKVFLRAAAVLVLLLAVGGAWFFAAQNDGGNPGANQTTAQAVQEETVTVLAEQAGRVHVLLPDGSEVWVHRQGAITYPEDFATNRTVTLEGEAYFSVAKQDGQPFIVKGESISVRVLGTEFLVRSGKCEPLSQVEVTSGAVEVTVNESTYVIGPSDRLIYEKRLEELLVTRVEPEEIAPWKGLDLVFENNTLDEVFQRISTYFGVTMAIDDRLPLNETITARISDSEPLEEVLFIVGNTSGTFSFEVEEDSVVITKR